MIRDQRRYDQSSVSAVLRKVVEAIVPLNVDVATAGAGNVGSGEDVLKTYTVPANTLGANYAKQLELEAWGVTGANADSKTIKLYFGAVVVAITASTANAKNWRLRLKVIYSAAGAQVVLGESQVDATCALTVTTGTEDETGTVVAKVTGQNNDNATNDSVVCKGFTVTQIEQKNAS
jgi:Cft2 family RNA processing exonuclease